MGEEKSLHVADRKKGLVINFFFCARFIPIKLKRNKIIDDKRTRTKAKT